MLWPTILLQTKHKYSMLVGHVSSEVNWISKGWKNLHIDWKPSKYTSAFIPKLISVDDEVNTGVFLAACSNLMSFLWYSWGLLSWEQQRQQTRAALPGTRQKMSLSDEGTPAGPLHVRVFSKDHLCWQKTGRAICSVMHPHTHPHFLLLVQTHATEVCMSRQLRLKLFLNSFRGLMPSFCLRSACCFSLEDKTCLSVPISSSSWTQTQKLKLHTQPSPHRVHF